MNLSVKDTLKGNWLGYLGLVLVIVSGAAHDLILLLRYPVAVGIDGYYYVLQVNSLLSAGRTYFPTHTPIAFYLLSFIARLSGNVTLGIKIGTVIFHSFLALGIFAILKKTLRSVWWAVLGAALVEISRLHLYLTSEFVANLCGITLLTWACFFSVRFLQRRRLWMAMASLTFILLAAFTHRSMLPMFMMISFSFLLFLWFASWTKRINWYAIGLAAMLFLAPGFLAAQPFIRLPQTVSREVTWVPGSILLDEFRPEGVLLLLAATGGIVWISKLRSKAMNGLREAYLLLGATICTLIVLQNPFLSRAHVLTSIAGRFALLSYLQVALITPAVFLLTKMFYPGVLKYAGCGMLGLLILGANGFWPYGMQDKVLSRRQELVKGLTGGKTDLPENAMVLASHGDEFIVTAVLGLPAQHDLPAGPNSQPLYWLVDVPSGSALSQGTFIAENSDSHITLISDNDLRSYLASANQLAQRRLFRLNLHMARTFPHSFAGRSSLGD
jgi:Dolichyl-phosphate-mannose-protein mannosyltransferase